MKLTKAKLQKIIREELMSESYKDDVKLFQTEVDKTESGWKERYSQLQERENTMSSVGRLQRSIHAVVEGFKKIPVTETLAVVNKGQAKKFERAMGMLESILEDTSGWIKENQ